MGIRWYPMGPKWHKSEDVKKQIFKPQKILIFNININILTILISILILILGFEKFWYWFWYWGWENFDIDIDFDIEEIVWRILILILILKTKFLKILILILNKNLILCHVWLGWPLFPTVQTYPRFRTVLESSWVIFGVMYLLSLLMAMMATTLIKRPAARFALTLNFWCKGSIPSRQPVSGASTLDVFCENTEMHNSVY